MTDPKATDYAISDDDARELLGVVTLPHEYRSMLLTKYAAERGTVALAELFSQFIGLANSVVANNREMAEMLLITEAKMHPHEAEKVNLPTLFGALNGVILARGVDQSKTCGGCAFRLGTCANQSPSTTCDADWCSDGEVQFMCHEDLDPAGNPTQKCTGFTQARRSRRKAGSA